MATKNFCDRCNVPLENDDFYKVEIALRRRPFDKGNFSVNMLCRGCALKLIDISDDFMKGK